MMTIIGLLFALLVIIYIMRAFLRVGSWLLIGLIVVAICNHG